MEKVLVKMERIEKIAKFIDMCDDCRDCPLYGKCQRYSDGCKEAIIDYLLGVDPPVTKKENNKLAQAMDAQIMNRKD